MAEYKSLTRNLFGIFLDANRGKGESMWVGVRFSEVYTLEMNPIEVTKGYIKDANDSTNVTGYAKTIPQETELIQGDPCYDLVAAMFREGPTGPDCIVPVLLTFPKKAGEEADPKVPADMYAEAALSLKTDSPKDGKLSFDIKLNGTETRGTVSAVAGAPVFTPNVVAP